MKPFLWISAVFLLIFTDVCSTEQDCATCSKLPSGTDSGVMNGPIHEKPMDCTDILENGNAKDGIYPIYPRSRLENCQFINVYCDMETDGGGWTVIQRRGQLGNPPELFDKTWGEYRDGFGDLKGEFWLGNDRIYAMTNQGEYEVRIDMNAEEGYCAYAHYANFWMENELNKYRLGVSVPSGPAGDSLIPLNGFEFATSDRAPRGVNATNSKGWWANGQPTSNLNGLNLFGTDMASQEGGIFWQTFKGLGNSLRTAEMKIRRTSLL